MTGTTNAVVGVFEDASDAILAVRALRDAGFPNAAIGIVSRDADTRRDKF